MSIGYCSRLLTSRSRIIATYTNIYEHRDLGGVHGGVPSSIILSLRLACPFRRRRRARGSTVLDELLGLFWPRELERRPFALNQCTERGELAGCIATLAPIVIAEGFVTIEHALQRASIRECR